MPQLSRRILLEAIEKYKPESIGSLRETLRSNNVTFTDSQLIEFVRELDRDHLIVLSAGHKYSLLDFLRESRSVWWLYCTLLIALLEAFLVIYDSQLQSISSLRALLSLVLLGYLPGYALTRAVLPKVSLPLLERLVLSIFLSVIVSIGAGTLLGAFFLFGSSANVILLGTLTILFALIGSYRTYKTTNRPNEEFLGPIHA